MKDLAQRFQGPLLLPKDLKSSGDGLLIISLLNEGAFRFERQTWYMEESSPQKR